VPPHYRYDARFIVHRGDFGEGASGARARAKGKTGPRSRSKSGPEPKPGGQSQGKAVGAIPIPAAAVVRITKGNNKRYGSVVDSRQLYSPTARCERFAVTEGNNSMTQTPSMEPTPAARLRMDS